jgi:hypothetical protein
LGSVFQEFITKKGIAPVDKEDIETILKFWKRHWIWP